jgi:hypothetical protein
VLLGGLKVVLRKSCWDACLDEALLAEAATLNLLYIQTVADIERGWIHTSAHTKQQLALMQVLTGVLVKYLSKRSGVLKSGSESVT